MSENRMTIIIAAQDLASDVVDDVNRSLDGFVQSVRESGRTLQTALGVGTMVAISGGVMQFVRSAREAESANIGLAVSARYAGENIDETLAAAKRLTEDGLMTMAEASKGLQNLLSRGFSLPEAITLMGRFKDAAAFNRQAALGFGEAVVGATEGLKNENSMLVDNAGVTKNVAKMWEEYADTIGVSAANLTQAQKRQAEYNGILKETEGQVGNTALAMENLAGMEARAQQAATDLSVTMGQSLAPAWVDILGGMIPIVRTMGELIGGFQMMSVEAAEWGGKMASIMSWEGMAGDETFSEYVARVKREFEILDQASEEQKEAIARRYTELNSPNIGKDTGTRRTDSSGGNSERTMGLRDQLRIESEMEIDAISARVAAWIAGEKKIAEARQNSFSSSASLGNEFSLSNPNSGDEMLTQSLLGDGGLTVWDQAKLNSALSLQVQLSDIRNAEMAADNLVTENSIANTEREARATMAAEQTIQSMRLSAMNSAIGLLQLWGRHNRIAAIAAIAVQKGLAMGQTFVSGKAAEIRALAELGPIAGPPMAAEIEFWTNTNMTLIAATGIAESVSGGSGRRGGTSGGGPTPGQIPAAPAAPAVSSAQTERGMTINFYGYVDASDPDDLARKISSALRKAEGDGY